MRSERRHVLYLFSIQQLGPVGGDPGQNSSCFLIVALPVPVGQPSGISEPYNEFTALNLDVWMHIAPRILVTESRRDEKGCVENDGN